MSSEASALLNLLLLAGWLGIGLLIARRSHAAGTALLWMVVFGPLGLILVAYGEAQRARVGPPPEGPTSPDLFIPVEVRTTSGWVPGTLHHWAVTSLGWHGWVTFDRDGAVAAEWFAHDAVRRDPDSPEGTGSADSPGWGA
jgi:hypothetical protein